MPNQYGGTVEFDFEANITAMKSQISDAMSRMTQLNDQVKNQGLGITNVFKGIGGTIAAAFSIQALMNFATKVIETRGEFESLQVAFETMLGSKEKADKIMNQAVQFAAKTPFSLQEVAGGVKQLMAFGTSADNAIKELKMLADIASGVGANLGDLVYVYGTLQTQGRAYSMDIRQFTMRGIPIYEGLAKVLKVNTNEVGKMVEAGKVGFPEVQQALRNLTIEGGKFYDLTTKNSTTLKGMWSNLKDAWSNLLNEIGKGQAWKNVVGWVTEITTKLQEGLKYGSFWGTLFGTKANRKAIAGAAANDAYTNFVQSLAGKSETEAFNSITLKLGILQNAAGKLGDEIRQNKHWYDVLFIGGSSSQEQIDRIALLQSYIVQINKLKALTKDPNWFKNSIPETPTESTDTKQGTTFEELIKQKKEEYAKYEAEVAVVGKETADKFNEALLKEGANFSEFLKRGLDKYKNDPEKVGLLSAELAPILEKNAETAKKNLENFFSAQKKASEGWTQSMDDRIKLDKEFEDIETEAIQNVAAQWQRFYEFMDEFTLKYGTLKEKISVTRSNANLELDRAGITDPAVRDKYINAMISGVISEEMQKTMQVASQLAGVFDGINKDLAQMVDSMAGLANGIFNATKDGASWQDIVSGTLESITSAYSLMMAFYKITDQDFEGQREKERLAYYKQVTALIKEQTDLISAQIGYVTELVGTKGLQAQFDLVTKINTQIKTFGTKVGSLLGIGSTYAGIAYISQADQLIKAQTYLVELQAKRSTTTDKTQQTALDASIAYYEEIINLVQQRNQLLDEANQKLTGTTAQSISDSIAQGFADGLTSVEDFADNTKEILRKALLEGFQAKYIDQQVADFYQYFATYAQQGLDEAKITQIQDYLNNIIANASTAWQSYEKIINDSGIAAGTDAKQSALAGAIKGITEATADVIAGQLNAMRLSALQQTDIAMRSYNTLVNIERNTLRTADNTSILLSIEQLIRNGNTSSLITDRAYGG